MMYRDEFLGPILEQSRTTYRDRIVEIAATELDPRKRTEKLTALSLALRVLDNVASGIDAAIRDGEIGYANLMKAEKVESMTDGKRRLFSMAPTR